MKRFVITSVALARVLALVAMLPLLPSVSADATSPECRAAMQTCAAGAPCPDIVIDGARAQASAYVTTETFTASDCAVQEGCTQPGRRKLLRFDMATGNVGTKDLPIGNPGAPSLYPCFIWSSCHNHFHFSAFGSYALRSSGSNVVAVGAKAAACVQDAFRWSGSTAPVLPTSQWYGCSNQGIHMGYQDVYGAHLDCQWVDVTGVAAGTYTLEIDVNTARVLAESNYDNNRVSFPVVIPADSGTVAPPSTDPSGCSTQGGCQSCTSASGGSCGWCSSAGYCAFGSYLGPSSGSCSQWTWGSSQCTSTDPTLTCAAKSNCQACATTTGCGWCPKTNQCSAGTSSGPSVGICPQLWQFGASNTCGNCAAFTTCSSCASATGCGFCASSNTCSGGTWQGPSSSSCANWVWAASTCNSATTPTNPAAAACTGSSLSRTGQTALGSCPSGTGTLASGASCQLQCNSGYTRSSGGAATCNNGAWSVTQSVCTANTPSTSPCVLPAAPAGTNGGCTAGASLASGSSCTYNVASGWALQSGSLTRTCSSGSFTNAAPVLSQSGSSTPSTCSAKSSCQTCAAQTGCGWCPGTNTCSAGSSSGPASGPACAHNLWQFGASNKCGKCESISSCGDCASATGCGWCGASGKCFGGTWLGPSGTSCAASSWTWSAASCAAAPVSANAVCTPASDCTSCTNLRGCGYCAGSNSCQSGTWAGPAGGSSCATWVWSAPSCQAASSATSRAANPTLTPARVARMALLGQSLLGDNDAAAVLAPADSSAVAVSSSDSFPADQLAFLSSLSPGVSPELFLTSAHLSLDEVLKADAAGNALKQRSDLSAGLKDDPQGNFLKIRPDIHLDRVERPAAVGEDGTATAASRTSAAAVADVQPAMVASAWDPDPGNALLPHGHYEHEEHNRAPVPAADSDGNVSQSDVGAAQHGATASMLVAAVLLVGLALGNHI